jgi:hypothetical protein
MGVSNQALLRKLNGKAQASQKRRGCGIKIDKRSEGAPRLIEAERLPDTMITSTESLAHNPPVVGPERFWTKVLKATTNLVGLVECLGSKSRLGLGHWYSD